MSGHSLRRHRRTAAAVAALLAPALLGGCFSGGGGDPYCDAYREEQQRLRVLLGARGEQDVLAVTQRAYERLRDLAPTELADEWDTVVFAYRAVSEVVEELGVDPATYDPKNPPAGLSEQDTRRLASVASELRSPRVVEAVRGIEEHATEVCNISVPAGSPED